MVWRAAVEGEARILLRGASAGVYRWRVLLDFSGAALWLQPLRPRGGRALAGPLPLRFETVADPFGKYARGGYIDFTAQLAPVL